MNMKNPSELMDYLLSVCTEKGNKCIYKLGLLGFLAGIFIAFGAVGSIVASSSLVKTNAGLAKFVAGAVFPVGLIMVVLLGVELFTSNCMLAVAVINKNITIRQLLKNWLIVYIFNFLGGVFIAYITIETHNFNEDSLLYLEKLALYKVSAPAYSLFLKGILCNVLVCGAVLLTYCAKDVIGKIFAAWFPIMLFIILGYDHCVANMLYLSAAKMAGIAITYSDIAYNLFFATTGNIVGGAFFIALPLYLTHHNKKSCGLTICE
ncbi:MAG: formate/nitrite transporter family protein [Fusobacterium sp.]|uniref:formate/nitrite transporter family protein n=1 Tax=Fusobacterium sp. TaxID=68766 RepID=UPI0026DD792D|nr:formate/nitrite transporter family protein [Fusobacterium sp.]MDO4690659.1 formate/nitrite transporter family protein [Fusobacterium sp.]